MVTTPQRISDGIDRGRCSTGRLPAIWPQASFFLPHHCPGAAAGIEAVRRSAAAGAEVREGQYETPAGRARATARPPEYTTAHPC